MNLLVLLASISFADVVGPDATGCPRGSYGTSNHGGSFCTPSAECSAGETCNDGESCQTVSLCILEEERPCGGMVTEKEKCTYTHREVFGRCSDQSDCDQGTCVTADRCVSASACGCAHGGPASALLLLGLLPLWARRREPAY